MRKGLHALWRTLRRLRGLVQDEDHDSWLDVHPSGQGSSPKVGPNLGGGAT